MTADAVATLARLLAGGPLIITDHAYRRALERLPSPGRGQEATMHRIETAVRDALREGRVSRGKPSWAHPPDDPTCVYALSAAGGVCYALRRDAMTDSGALVVTTIMTEETSR